MKTGLTRVLQLLSPHVWPLNMCQHVICKCAFHRAERHQSVCKTKRTELSVEKWDRAMSQLLSVGKHITITQGIRPTTMKLNYFRPKIKLIKRKKMPSDTSDPSFSSIQANSKAVVTENHHPAMSFLKAPVLVT